MRSKRRHLSCYVSSSYCHFTFSHRLLLYRFSPFLLSVCFLPFRLNLHDRVFTLFQQVTRIVLYFFLFCFSSSFDFLMSSSLNSISFWDISVLTTLVSPFSLFLCLPSSFVASLSFLLLFNLIYVILWISSCNSFHLLHIPVYYLSTLFIALRCYLLFRKLFN